MKRYRAGRGVATVVNDLRKLLNAAEAQGFTVQRTRKGHCLVRNAEGLAVATLVTTASDHRSWSNSLPGSQEPG